MDPSSPEYTVGHDGRVHQSVVLNSDGKIVARYAARDRDLASQCADVLNAGKKPTGLLVREKRRRMQGDLEVSW